MKAARKPRVSRCSAVSAPERNTGAPKRNRHGFSFILLRQGLLCVLATTVSVVPSSAQKIKYSPNFGAAGKPEVSVVDNATFNAKPAADEEKCLPWSLSQARVTTVSIARLKIPPKARREYEMACDAFNKNKFEDAEKHARGATEKLQEYSAAWVMLGVILEAQKKVQEARDACSRAATIDVTYLPAYLCGAAISARNGEWQEALNFADQALGLQSEGNAYGHFYRATAYLHMNNLVEAKKSALQAVAIDVNHDEPSLCLLLAEVYDREGDTVDAIAQLQQFLKRRTDRRQEDAAKRFLARLEAQQPAN